MNIVISGNINKIIVGFLIQKEVYIANLIAQKGCFLHLKMLKSKNFRGFAPNPKWGAYSGPYPPADKIKRSPRLAFSAARKLVRPPSFFDFGTALFEASFKILKLIHDSITCHSL